VVRRVCVIVAVCALVVGCSSSSEPSPPVVSHVRVNSYGCQLGVSPALVVCRFGLRSGLAEPSVLDGLLRATDSATPKHSSWLDSIRGHVGHVPVPRHRRRFTVTVNGT
jgi:hypothetical protein